MSLMRFPALLLLASLCAFAADDRVKVDNEWVRILKVTDKPHNKGPLHKHDSNRVMIYLDAGDIELTYQDGRKDKQHWKANQVAWSPGGPLHTSENVGSNPIRIVEIEIKKPGPAKPATRNPKLDPVALDPKHNVVLFENDQVRVFKTSVEPGATEKMHEHPAPGRVAVLLTDLDAVITNQDGSAVTQRGAAGDVMWSGPSIHAGKNVGSKTFEVILVELK